jgi:hypothetical protein
MFKFYEGLERGNWLCPSAYLLAVMGWLVLEVAVLQ